MASQESTYKKLVAKGMSPKAARAFAAHADKGKGAKAKPAPAKGKAAKKK